MSSMLIERAADAVVSRIARSVVVIGQEAGYGAGVVWAPGLVVTNDHVAQSSQATVEDSDGRRQRGAVVARDERNDLALVSVSTSQPPVEVADWRDLRVGQVVFAFGHPLGLRNHATLGIVSGLRDSTWMGHSDRPLIQADLALAPGNSGGPIFDAEGRVVGIAAMVASPGIALAVPSFVVARFVASRWKGTQAA